MNKSEKVILITGSADGLGKVVAADFAIQGAEIILHGRNEQKGEAVLKEIQKSSGNKNINYFNADFSSLKEVKEFAEKIIDKYKKLNVLINNAGIGAGPKEDNRREISADGFELRFAVNYLSHFLLTYSLLPLLKKSAPSRIVNVSSVGQEPINFNDVMMEKNYDGFRAYKQSKLALIMFTFGLAEELRGTGVTVNSLHPASLMNTKMVFEYFDRVLNSVEKGAEAVEYLAVSEEIKDVTGTYYDGKKPSRALDQAYDNNTRKKLNEISLELTGLK